jgi:hypothetical protein
MLQRARRLEARAIRETVDAALVRLREDPGDATARQEILALRAKAAPTLRQRLADVLAAEPLDLEAERRLHDLLKAVEPSWPGFAPEASIEEKARRGLTITTRALADFGFAYVASCASPVRVSSIVRATA